MTSGEPISVLHNRAAGFSAGGTANRNPFAFHQRLPGYAPTPLIDVTSLADRLGLGRVLVKCESNRFDLPSFKILGTSWAAYQALVDRLGGEPAPWNTLEELADRFRGLRPLTFAAATDGNHGRAVACVARWFGFDAKILVPSGTAVARIEAIESEGADVAVIDGSYDDAVAKAADEAGDRCLVISDTSWPGYERIPRWVIEGYSTIFWEIEDVLSETGQPGADALVVPIGVGALASSAALWARSTALNIPVLAGVEPAEVPCMTRSVEAGYRLTIEGPHRTIMSGLRCGTPSMTAFPIVAGAFEWFVLVADDQAVSAMRELAEAGIVSGETGASALAGLTELLAHPGAERFRQEMEPIDVATVIVLSTEGDTDPESYLRLVGRSPDEVRVDPSGAATNA